VADVEVIMSAARTEAGVRQLGIKALAGLVESQRIRIAPPLALFRDPGHGHFHPRPELFVQVLGCCDMQLEPGWIRSEAGDLLVIPRGVAHDEHPKPGPFLNLVFSYSDHGFAFHAAQGQPVRGTRILHRYGMGMSGIPRLYGYLNDAAACMIEGAPTTHVAVQALVRAHLALLLDALRAGPAVGQEDDQLVLQARHSVAVHLTDAQLSVAWLARRLRCSADYLSHRFHTVTGQRLVDFITTERCSLARRLLADVSLSIKEVAVACGYRDPAYFSRVFRKQVGVNPRAWRKTQR
jgi:AraC-like DNA-binding protein